ncbi:N-acetylglutamate synthase [Pseudonocardia thermophila]|uniref:N-acetylglutamate synthase n=1 Tax=Pseudonocardia thermophila TaxID=1848 RepID=A0A1M6QYD0_PSETH|nr:N-acetylglutamate synthase [Pseudonocardia thermophila]
MKQVAAACGGLRQVRNRVHVVGIAVRRARTPDVRTIKQLVDHYAGKVLLAKEIITLYESVQEFFVAEVDGEVVGCGALHVMWEDLGEVRTVAVRPDMAGRGIGHAIVSALIDQARELGLQRLFVLTFEKQFFSRHGFEEIDGTPVEPDVFAAMLRSYDAGVAEFLDLAHVKPNTLGNVRMLLHL